MKSCRFAAVCRRLAACGSCLAAPIALLALLMLPAAPSGGDNQPFDTEVLEVGGRPTQVWSVSASAHCPGGALDLMVITLEGAPPNERRSVALLPCGQAGRTQPTNPLVIPIEPHVVAVDIYDVDGVPGGELLLLSRRGIRVVSPWGLAPPREIAVPGGLPLPPRHRKLSRMPVAGNWDGDGRPLALLPTLDGGQLVDLRSGEARPIELPVIANYRTWDPDLPGRVRKLMISEIHWPVLMQSDDNGDGRADLFALSRWDIWVYHSSQEGLPAAPSRRLELQPFSEQQEERFEATDVTYYANDINGDGLADLALHRVSGGLMAGTATTDIYLNEGTGARPVGRPHAQLTMTNGFSGMEPIDLDGDGSSEIVSTSIEFGILQLVRILLTRRAEVTTRVLAWNREGEPGFHTSWEQDSTVHINFSEGRLDGLSANMKGDWNGDGRSDFIYPDGEQRMSIRLGVDGETGPAFGKPVAKQTIELSAGQTRVVDLNGDGLDDLVAYDPRDQNGRVLVLYNRGVLPGTKPGISAGETQRPRQ